MNSYDKASVPPPIQTEQRNALLSSKQKQMIDEFQLPQRVFLKSATEFDDQFLYLKNDWRYRFSGENKSIPFSNGKDFIALDPYLKKLIKMLCLRYIEENSASSVNDLAACLAKTFGAIDSLTRGQMINYLHSLVSKVDRNAVDERYFYYTLFALRRLDREDFFEKSTSEDNKELEDLLLEVPRPRGNNFGVYQNLDLVIPEEVCLMIENGILRWSSRLTPMINNQEERIAHREKLKNHLNITKLLDCVITGIVYYTGCRAVQISKLAAGDIMVDSRNEYGARFSLAVPYAKNSKLTMSRIRVAIPEELGKLIVLYIRLKGLGKEEALLPVRSESVRDVNNAISRMLLLFSPKEIQAAVKNEDYELPRYTSGLFRHNVGHSMARNGASAYEIAYILGHSSLVAANKYIAATPDMADIREYALGRNPVFKNMMILMLTGHLVHSNEWTGRWVAGVIGGKLHHHIGGCNYEEDICPFSQGRACYGCLYFKPFSDGLHHAVFDSFNDEIAEVRDIADDTAASKHPLLNELTRRKQHVYQVIARIDMLKSKGGKQ